MTTWDSIFPTRARWRASIFDSDCIRSAAERVAAANLAKATDPEFAKENTYALFQPTGETNLTRLLFQSVLGPIGQPAAEAAYPALVTADGAPMNVLHDCGIRMEVAGSGAAPMAASEDAVLTQQERAYTSPIWYSP
ncbi:MAG: DUF3604 domain-containing protein [Gammaproteobacteria bacterium]|nr:DUF3604 domain-containing protein [Gammaproteobacteria bacterium]